ncbi:hypothetical protein [Actinomyces urogenitalis]|jgi:hypothetical protein|uniref:hypothetical protein n=1 Tax=Actinomyces urogenitalis TaxID=103621 RepID=UPI001896CA7F|nr:hypothetical protein [Actinomyces urogenitalis]MDK8236790.1 hypothetical protein [Actinomyces urogenitalis]WOO94854.1 hypothetical protein R3I39_09240 [Actinomyces urogenitalis]
MVKVTHNIAGYRALRHDPAVQALCEQLAARLASQATAAATIRGARYTSAPDVLAYRGGASTSPDGYKARLDNARNNTLLAALGGA